MFANEKRFSTFYSRVLLSITSAIFSYVLRRSLKGCIAFNFSPLAVVMQSKPEVYSMRNVRTKKKRNFLSFSRSSFILLRQSMLEIMQYLRRVIVRD